MDRKQMVVQRVREYFGDRLDDLVHVLRQDRQEMRGWQEPAHVRAVVRRSLRVAADSGETERAAVAELTLGRGAAEPDLGQQREATGQLLEAGLSGLERLIRDENTLSAEEVLGLECVLLLYGRPAVQAGEEGLASVPPFWNVLEDQREDVEMAQRGVGRIELLGHPEYDWAGTGFLVNENVLMTTRRVAELFVEQRGEGRWQFRPGITAWMNYRTAYQSVSGAGYRLQNVVGVHDRYDLALFEVERPQLNGTAPAPLALAALAPERLEGRAVYLIGYPVRDARRNEPETIARIFRDVYNVKRVEPGLLRGSLSFHEVHLLRHDCGPLGGTAGAPLLDLETHQVLGLQTTSRYLDSGIAVPLYALRDDPLLRRAGVTFAEATAKDREAIVAQIERLSRSRYWNEVRLMVANLYQRAFGTPPAMTR